MVPKSSELSPASYKTLTWLSRNILRCSSSSGESEVSASATSVTGIRRFKRHSLMVFLSLVNFFFSSSISFAALGDDPESVSAQSHLVGTWYEDL